MRKDPASPQRTLASVSNALHLLSMLQTTPSLRVVDVARSLGIAGSTSHRLLTCLKDEGFIRQPSRSRHYVAGPELLRLARHFSDQNTLERVAHPHLASLCKEVNEAVNLQILVGSEVLCIDSVVEDRHSLQVHHIAGQRAVAHVSAAGKLLLSALKRTELDDLLAHGRQSRPEEDPVNLTVLHAELEAIRARGYATNMGEREAGVHAVAVPVLDLEGNHVAAVSVAAPSVRLPHIRIAGLVQHLQVSIAAITAEYFAVFP